MVVFVGLKTIFHLLLNSIHFDSSVLTTSSKGISTTIHDCLIASYHFPVSDRSSILLSIALQTIWRFFSLEIIHACAFPNCFGFWMIFSIVSRPMPDAFDILYFAKSNVVSHILLATLPADLTHTFVRLLGHAVKNTSGFSVNTCPATCTPVFIFCPSVCESSLTKDSAPVNKSLILFDIALIVSTGCVASEAMVFTAPAHTL